MLPGIFHLALRSLFYYRKKVLQQIAIVALLAAIITGSLLTGFSVRESLKRSASEKLGNTRFLVSAGLRYFNRELPARLNDRIGTKSTALLETDGFVQGFAGGKKSLGTKIYGISKEYFVFQGINTVSLNQGEIALNSSLARKLNIKPGDQLILTLTPPSDIPAGSPFAVPPSSGNSGVFTVAAILGNDKGGNFSTSVNQALPDNIFMNLDEDLLRGKVNRLLIGSTNRINLSDLIKILKGSLDLSDYGLSVRSVRATGEAEIISKRIFLDRELIDDIRSLIPEAKPVISWLVNSVSHNGRSAPYFFASGLSHPALPADDKIEVNEWLSKDIGVNVGDTIKMTWYSPLNSGRLEEISSNFIVGRIAGIKGWEADSLLMPEFPGIAGKASCSRWNAGVEIRTDLIRKKDEDYWNRYRGTPKVLMSYEKAKELWGSNFGPATAIRIPQPWTPYSVSRCLTGRISPSSAGFTITDISSEMNEAAKKSVDFGSLFLSLGFFIIVACVVILMLAVSSYFETRRKELSVYRSAGFTGKWIKNYLFIESSFISFIGAFAGAMAGMIINVILIRSLNSVWSGAVQTAYLKAFNSLVPVLTGFTSTFLLSSLFLLITIRRFLNKKVRDENEQSRFYSLLSNRTLLYLILLFPVVFLILNFTTATRSPGLAFATGAMLFIALLEIRIFNSVRYLRSGKKNRLSFRMLSAKYYAQHPSEATLPVLLIAAGLFAVVITGINRLKINEKSLSVTGGTGGVKYWIETSVPVKEDLNTSAGKRKHGLESLPESRVKFIQCKKAAGNDASCLNLNFVGAPALLGLDPADFIENRAFSFSTLAPGVNVSNPWTILSKEPEKNIVFGFADQTVLEWGLKKKTGDTIKLRSESGKVLNVVIAGGLRSSVFQGYLLIGLDNFNRYYPSVPGYSVIMVRDKSDASDSLASILSDRFDNYGISVGKASDRLASFFTVTNTYLSVFTILGFFGMLLGVTGLGFVLKRIYDSRKKEFALMISAGFTLNRIKLMIIREQAGILAAGIFTGVIPGIVASSSSVSSFAEIPWLSLLVIIITIAATGMFSLYISVKGISHKNLVAELKTE